MKFDAIRYKDWEFFKHKNIGCFINPQNNAFHNWIVDTPKYYVVLIGKITKPIYSNVE